MTCSRLCITCLSFLTWPWSVVAHRYWSTAVLLFWVILLTHQPLSYDTTFYLGDVYASVLLFRMTAFQPTPVIPALFLIHDYKTSITHQEFFSHCLSPSFQPFKHASTTGDRPRTSYCQSHCFLSAACDTPTWVEPPATGDKVTHKN